MRSIFLSPLEPSSLATMEMPQMSSLQGDRLSLDKMSVKITPSVVAKHKLALVKESPLRIKVLRKNYLSKKEMFEQAQATEALAKRQAEVIEGDTLLEELMSGGDEVDSSCRVTPIEEMEEEFRRFWFFILDKTGLSKYILKDN